MSEASERDAHPFWLAMGAAFVGTLLGGAAVWFGVSDRLDARPAISGDAAVSSDGAEVGEPSAAGDAGVEASDSGATPTAEAHRHDDPRDSPLVRAIAEVRDSVVTLELGGSASGAGVVYDQDGALLLTNHHVIEPVLRARALFGAGPATQITARFADGRARRARIIAADPDEDVAILRLDRELDDERFDAAPVGRSSELRLGEQVFAIGSPVGFEATVATGIVSALERTEVLANRQLPLIQLDAAINFGNSGGPLFNLEGELVGITTARSSRGEGIGFAIPIDRIRLFLRSLEQGKSGRAGMVGVELDAGAAVAERITPLGYRSGIQVAAVSPGRPGEAAGLRPGDVIVSIRGRRYDDLDASRGGRLEFGRLFGKTIRGLLPGESVKIEVVRPGEQGGEGGEPHVVELELEVEAASVPEQARIDAEELLGLRLDPDSSKPKILGLVPGTPIAGVRGVEVLEGATITELFHRPVDDLEGLGQRLAKLRAGGRGGRRSIAIAFESAEGEAIEVSFYPLVPG